MTVEFDPARHKIVAVVTDEGDEKGQHFHLSLPDLVQEIRETKVIEHHPADTTALATFEDRLAAVESRPAVVTELVPADVPAQIPEEFAERLQFIARGLDTLTARLERIEAQGQLSATDADDLVKGFSVRLDQTVDNAISERLGDINGRLATIEQREPPQVAKQVQTLGEVVRDLGKFLQAIEESIESNKGDIEQRYSAIAAHIASVEKRLVSLATFSRGLADLVKDASLETA